MFLHNDPGPTDKKLSTFLELVNYFFVLYETFFLINLLINNWIKKLENARNRSLSDSAF